MASFICLQWLLSRRNRIQHLNGLCRLSVINGYLEKHLKGFSSWRLIQSSIKNSSSFPLKLDSFISVFSFLLSSQLVSFLNCKKKFKKIQIRKDIERVSKCSMIWCWKGTYNHKRIYFSTQVLHVSRIIPKEDKILVVGKEVLSPGISVERFPGVIYQVILRQISTEMVYCLYFVN